MTYTREELEAWQGAPLDDDQIALERFLIPIKANAPGFADPQQVLLCEAYGMVTPEMLDTPIPTEALVQVYGEDPENPGQPIPAVVGRTLRDFALSHVELTVSDTRIALFVLSANYKVIPSWRGQPTTAADGMQWLALTAPFGVTAETAKTRAEFKEIVTPVEEI